MEDCDHISHLNGELAVLIVGVDLENVSIVRSRSVKEAPSYYARSIQKAKSA